MSGLNKLACLLLLASPAAVASEVYLLATMQFGGSNLAQSIFLHEPSISRLADCQEAVRLGQRDRDWAHYRHFLNHQRFQGFTAELNYQCVLSDQHFSAWNDRARYNQAYLIRVDEQSRLSLKSVASQAQCVAQLAALSPEQAQQTRCALGNQTVVP